MIEDTNALYEDVNQCIQNSENDVKNTVVPLSKIEAKALLEKQDQVINDLEQEKSIFENEIRLKSLILEKDNLKKDNNSLKSKIGNNIANTLDDSKIVFDGINFIYGYVKTSRDGLLSISESFRSKYQDYVLLLIGDDNNSYPLVSFVSGKALSKGFKAGEIIRNVSILLNGKGGGRNESAFGNGKDLTNLNEVEKLINIKWKKFTNQLYLLF